MDNAKQLLQYYTQHPFKVLDCPLEVQDFGHLGNIFEQLKKHIIENKGFDSVIFGLDSIEYLLELDLFSAPTFALGLEEKLIKHLRESRLNRIIKNANNLEDLTDLEKLKLPQQSGKAISLKGSLHDFFNFFAETLERKEKSGTVGLPLDLKLFDENCLVPNTLLVLGARTSIGKSAVAINMAFNLARNSGKTLYMTAEMDYNSILSRFYSLSTNLPVSDFSNANNPKAVEVAYDRVQELGGDVHIKYCGGWSWDKVKTFIIAQEGFDMIIFDHLHYLPIPPRANEVQFLTDVITESKMIAGNMRNTFVMLAQVNRAAGEESEPPKIYHLRGSGGIEQGADIVGMFHRPDRSEGHGEICIAKNRGGQAGRVYQIRLNLQTLKLTEY